MPVCPSVRLEQLGFRWTDFHEILYLNNFRKSVKKIQIPLKPDKYNGYFAWKPIYIFNVSLISSWNEKCLWQKLQRKLKKKKQKQQILDFSQQPYTLWDNVERYFEQNKLQMEILHMCIALEATDIQSEYVIIIAYPLQRWLHIRTSLLRLYLLWSFFVAQFE